MARGLRAFLQHRLLDRVPLRLKRRVARVVPRSMLRRQKLGSIDAVVVSAPKAGRTWLRVMLGRYLCSHFDLKVEPTLDLEELARGRRDVPRLHFSHDELDCPRDWRSLAGPDKMYFSTRLVLLVRDPRDIAVSLYYQRRFRDRDFEGDLSAFIREDRGAFLTTLEFYRRWARASATHRRCLVVRYEDLRREPEAMLLRILEHIGVEGIRRQCVDDAVDFAALENMRRLEVGGSFDGRLRPRDAGDPRTFKTREGRVGGYLQELDRADVRWMNEILRTRFPDVFGYGFADAGEPSETPSRS